MRAPIALTLLAAVLVALPAASAEQEILYPAKVQTISGRVFEFADLRTEFERGSFVIYDGETEGRIPWRDIDRVVFVDNIGHGLGALGPKKPGTERVRVEYVDGQSRIVNVAMGTVWGNDGMDDRRIRAQKLSLIDFDTSQIAPKLYKACARGHVWEQEGYRYCPYDGEPVTAYRVDMGR